MSKLDEELKKAHTVEIFNDDGVMLASNGEILRAAKAWQTMLGEIDDPGSIWWSQTGSEVESAFETALQQYNDTGSDR